MLIGIKLLAFSAGKGVKLSAEKSRALATKMHGLEKSKGRSYHPLTKSIKYLNSTKNVQCKVAMHVQHVKENNVSL